MSRPRAPGRRGRSPDVPQPRRRLSQASANARSRRSRLRAGIGARVAEGYDGGHGPYATAAAFPVVSDGACSPLGAPGGRVGAPGGRGRVGRRAGSQAPRQALPRCGGPAYLRWPHGDRMPHGPHPADPGAGKRHWDPVRETARPKGGQRPRAISRTVHGYTLPFRVRQLRAGKGACFQHVSRATAGVCAARKCRGFCGTAA